MYFQQTSSKTSMMVHLTNLVQTNMFCITAGYLSVTLAPQFSISHELQKSVRGPSFVIAAVGDTNNHHVIIVLCKQSLFQQLKIKEVVHNLVLNGKDKQSINMMCRNLGCIGLGRSPREKVRRNLDCCREIGETEKGDYHKQRDRGRKYMQWE